MTAPTSTHRTWVVRLPGVSARLPARLLVTAAALATCAVVLAVGALSLGDYPLPPDQVVTTLFGGGGEFDRMVVLSWRLPVALAAVVFGTLLGVGGAIFQSLTRNPLGSPDVIGFDAGSYAAVVITIVLLGHGSYWTLATASITGGLATAMAVYLLAYRRGVQGFRLIVVGIGVSAMLGSLNAYLITRADIEDAMSVGFWGAGSIGRVSWSSLVPSLGLAVVLLAAAALLSGALRRLELGDDAAITLGTPVGRVRLALIVVGVATTALVTAVAGPIGFVALVAPQLARRLSRSAGVSLLGSAAMGAALLTAAHLLSLLVAQRFQPVPVGLVTVCIGGLYLIWLLVKEARREYQS